MIRHENIGALADTIRLRPDYQTEEVGSLKSALRAGLADFEELLEPLSEHDREATLSMFLERIRETAVEFHLAVLKLIARDELRENPTRENVQVLIARCEEDMQRIARLYRLL